MYLAVRHFRGTLEGRNFAIYTDHKPLCGAITSSVEKSPRQTRHLAFIAENSTDIRHVSGASNVVADALSRPAPPASLSAAEVNEDDTSRAFLHDGLVGTISLCAGLDFSALAAAQSAEEFSSSAVSTCTIFVSTASIILFFSLYIFCFCRFFSLRFKNWRGPCRGCAIRLLIVPP